MHVYHQLLSDARNMRALVLQLVVYCVVLEAVSTAVCPSGFFNYGNQCFKFIDEEMTWEEGAGRCASDGLVLAQPTDSIAIVLRKNILDNCATGDAITWVGARGTGNSVSWGSSGSQVRPDLIYPGDEVKVARNYCMVLASAYEAVVFNPLEPYIVWDCSLNAKVLCQEEEEPYLWSIIPGTSSK